MLSQAPRVSDIRNFLAVLLLGIMVACAIVGSMVYFYSPSGRYWSHHVLLAPEVIQKHVYDDVNSSNRQVTHYVFERIEFTYFDKSKSKWVSVPVHQDAYEQFWELVKDDWSVIKITDEITESFHVSHPSYLAVWVRPEPATAPVKVFQHVYFSAQGDLYRVELHGQGDVSGQWAYFEHSRIYQRALDLFTTQP